MAYLLLGLMDDVPKDKHALVVCLYRGVMLADEPNKEQQLKLLEQ
jgi:hypothetical protein